MPVTEDPLATLKLDSFYEYLDKAEKAELKERLIKCNLPYDKEKAQDYARALISVYESGSLYDLSLIHLSAADWRSTPWTTTTNTCSAPFRMSAATQKRQRST